MLDFNKYEYCCGCGACFNICPTSAISMKDNEEGFQEPHIDENKCLNCGKCDSVCPHINALLSKQDIASVQGAWLYSSSDETAKKRSASGAAFYEIAKYMLSKEAFLCGCVWNEKLTAIHIISDKDIDLRRMQGSKYLQSDMGKCYRTAIDLLRQGKTVFFSGTPCQAVAMHECTMSIDNGKYRDNLITAAVLCHGVTSPLAWKSFKKWTEEKEKSPLIGVNFRDKSKEGYKRSYCKYEYASGKITYLPTYFPSSKYIEATLVYNLAIRSSCSHCDCKGVNAAIDLILGDWYASHHGDGALGTSCVVAYTERGRKCAESSLEKLRAIPFEAVIRDNGYIIESVELGKKRKDFFYKIKDYHCWDNIEKLYPPKYKYKKLFLKMGLYEVIKKIKKKVFLKIV